MAFPGNPYRMGEWNINSGFRKDLKISQIFGVSTDYLLKDEMEEASEEVKFVIEEEKNRSGKFR